jgi:hypothetical protein
MNTSMDPNATHVHKFYARKCRLVRIQLRRNQNATARRLGFKNYQAWQGED